MPEKTMKKRNAEIRLSRKFYDESVVNMALNEFREIFSGTLCLSEDEIVIGMEGVKGDPDIISREFCNFLLSEMKNQSLR
jgi:hypothetical protein